MNRIKLEEKFRIDNKKKPKKNGSMYYRKKRKKRNTVEGNKIMENPEWVHSSVCCSKIYDRIREDAIWGNHSFYYPMRE